MASFAYSGASRFCDGTFGVYYAAFDEETAIAETRYNTEKRLREWREPSIDVDKRVYVGAIAGEFEDLRAWPLSDPVYHPENYGASQAYATSLYAEDRADGIVYQSVRHAGGENIVAFRPRVVSHVRIAKYLQFRWDGNRIVAVTELTNIRAY